MWRGEKNDGFNNELELRRQLEWLRKDNARLEEEKRALTLKSEGVQVLGTLLEQSKHEADEMKQKLAELTKGQKKLKQTESKQSESKVDSFSSYDEKSSSPRSLDRSQRLTVDEMVKSTNTSPWNTLDSEKVQEVVNEVQEMAKRNTELTSKLEATLQEPANFYGSEKELVRNLKSELEEYKSLSHGTSDRFSQLCDEADRLKTKLTSTAIKRGSTLGKSQDDIEAMKSELEDLEIKAPRKVFDIEQPLSPPTKIELRANSLDLHYRYPKFDSLDEHFRAKELENDPLFVTELSPSVKPRTDNRELRELKKVNAEQTRALAELKSQTECLQSEKAELIKVNHAWEGQYRKLQERTRSELKNRDSSFQQLQKQLSQEHKKSSLSGNDLLEQKDAMIEEQSEKIRSLKDEIGKIHLDSMKYMQTKYENDMEMRYQRAKKLFQDQKKENEIIVKREQALLEESQMWKEEEQFLHRQVGSLRSRNKILENELQRLAGVVESFAAGKRDISQSRSSPASLMLETPETRRQDSVISAEQIEVLKQQISIYAEDFNSEKEEKDGLLAENKRLKEKLREAESEAEDCRRQMQMFENDFRMEREERFRLSRLNQADPYMDIKEPPGFALSKKAANSPDMLRQYQEYCQLVVARNKMAERILDLEHKGVDKYAPRSHDVFFNTGFNARGSPQPLIAKPPSPDNCQTEDSMFYGGDVVRDDFEKPTKDLSKQHKRSYVNFTNLN